MSTEQTAGRDTQTAARPKQHVSHLAEGKAMDICDLCKEQAKKQRNAEPHQYLKPVGEQRAVRGVPTGGYEEQDYACQKCGAEFTYSNDKNDYGWILHSK